MATAGIGGVPTITKQVSNYVWAGPVSNFVVYTCPASTICYLNIERFTVIGTYAPSSPILIKRRANFTGLNSQDYQIVSFTFGSAGGEFDRDLWSFKEGTSAIPLQMITDTGLIFYPGDELTVTYPAPLGVAPANVYLFYSTVEVTSST